MADFNDYLSDVSRDIINGDYLISNDPREIFSILNNEDAKDTILLMLQEHYDSETEASEKFDIFIRSNENLLRSLNPYYGVQNPFRTRAFNISENIIQGNYIISTDNNEIIEVLNNEPLMGLIFARLEEHYGIDSTESQARYNNFYRINSEIIRDLNNEENTLRDNINIDPNFVINNNDTSRQSTPPTPEPNIINRPPSIPQSVISLIPEQVINVITCPISGEIMRDPVINSVGQTYDRTSIQEWLNRGNRTDPNTRQNISTQLITNFSIKSLINSYIPQLGGKRTLTKKNKKYKKNNNKNKKTKNNKKNKRKNLSRKLKN